MGIKERLGGGKRGVSIGTYNGGSMRKEEEGFRLAFLWSGKNTFTSREGVERQDERVL